MSSAHLMHRRDMLNSTWSFGSLLPTGFGSPGQGHSRNRTSASGFGWPPFNTTNASHLSPRFGSPLEVTLSPAAADLTVSSPTYVPFVPVHHCLLCPCSQNNVPFFFLLFAVCYVTEMTSLTFNRAQLGRLRQRVGFLFLVCI